MPFLLMLHFKICRCFPWLPLPGRGSCSKGLADLSHPHWPFLPAPLQKFPAAALEPLQCPVPTGEAPREWGSVRAGANATALPRGGSWSLPSRANPWGAKATQTGKETSPGLGNPSPAKPSCRAWLPPALSRLSPAFGDAFAFPAGDASLLECCRRTNYRQPSPG